MQDFVPYNVFFALAKVIYICIYHFQHSCLLWLLCKGRRTGNRAGQYKSGGGQLYPDPVCRLYIICLLL